MTKNANNYDEKNMKIKFNLDDDLPLNKTIEIDHVKIVVRAVFHENNKYYPQVFLNIKVLHYDRIDISEGIDVNKTSRSKECDICHYWYFLNKDFKSQQNVCNRCHDLLMMSMNLSDIAILNIKVSDYCCIICGIRKSETINLMQNTDLTKKSRTL